MFLDQLAHRAKAVAGFVVAGIATYVGDAIISGHAVTGHGAELAAVAAVMTAIGVHQAPSNKKAKSPANVRVVPRRARTQPDLEERIVQAEAQAAQACRNHDREAEWAAECDCWALYEERASIPEQRANS